MSDIKQHIELLQLIEYYGFSAKLVGGAVRDFFLKIKFNDIDIATTAKPSDIKNIAEKENLKYIAFGEQYGACRLFFKEKLYEITTLRNEKNGYKNIQFTNSFEIDSMRRDFTINAIYLDSNKKIYDYHNGLNDLKNHRIIFIGEPKIRIQQDPIRILRYVRFCIKYGDANIDKNIIFDNIKPLQNANKSKIINELIKILSLKNAKKITQILNIIFYNLFDINFTHLPQNAIGKNALYRILSSSKNIEQLSENFGLSLSKLLSYKV